MLEALGVEIELTPEQVATCIEEIGFGFMFAPKHHKATAHVVPVRKELAVRTIFNMLGPLTNPAGARRQLLGVSDRSFQETIAEALLGLGCEHAMVVSADDGLDELSIASRTRVVEVHDGRTDEWFVEAEDLGLETAPLDAIPGGTPDENAAVVRGILGGEAGAAARGRPPQRRRHDLRRRRRGEHARRGRRRRARRSIRARPARCWSGSSRARASSAAGQAKVVCTGWG